LPNSVSLSLPLTNAAPESSVLTSPSHPGVSLADVLQKLNMFEAKADKAEAKAAKAEAKAEQALKIANDTKIAQPKGLFPLTCL